MWDSGSIDSFFLRKFLPIGGMGVVFFCNSRPFQPIISALLNLFNKISKSDRKVQLISFMTNSWVICYHNFTEWHALFPSATDKKVWTIIYNLCAQFCVETKIRLQTKHEWVDTHQYRWMNIPKLMSKLNGKTYCRAYSTSLLQLVPKYIIGWLVWVLCPLTELY